jgi:hypothetical protein
MTPPYRARWHDYAAWEPGPPCALCFARFLGFRLVVIECSFDPRKLTSDHLFDLDQNILNVAAIATGLCYASLVFGHRQRLAKAIKTSARQRERIEYKGLRFHPVRLGNRPTREKSLRPRFSESGYASLSRCSCRRLLRQAFDRSGSGS